MQNVSQESSTDNPKIDKVTVLHELGNSSSTPHSTSNSSPAKSETETYSEHRRYMSETSESEEDSVSEVESFMIDQSFEDDPQVEAAKFLLNPEEERTVDPETQARLEQLLQAAGIGQLSSKDGKHLGDPEVLRRLTSSVSCALDEAAAALTRMRADNPRAAASQPAAGSASAPAVNEKTSLVEACTDGDVGTVRKLLTEGRSVHETSEEGESLLSLACSAGYFELAQVLLAMHANVEDRGIKGECTPLMEAASAGHLDIVRLLVAHGADVNAQSTTGNTPLMYGCAGGHTEVVKYLLENGANVEDHNENGHTPLMEAASAGHVGLAKILLQHGAGINTHSNEFKESALTLACYKGHLDMVRFLLEAGADQEHKTDEMHTALMEASMDGHVEVARLLLDSGAQVNMPTDSFESPLTLAACGGHVDLAMLLIERGANIEEVNDEGYTPLMEAAREGHEEMVHLLLGQGANINAQTDETQETALTLACCGGFTEVADILLKGGADIELGASTPLMEAAQEGHLELVRFLLENGANVHATTQTGDTALTYACENGHTDVADLLLQYEADLEHESEGGRTPLMKACRAGHLCTVQFLIAKGANVRRQTTNNDHTPLSLACAGGHLPVVEALLSHNADPNHKLKDNSTMLIEAAKGGHTNVVQLLLDYPHSMQPMVLNQQQPATTATNLSMLPGQLGSRDSPLPAPSTMTAGLNSQSVNFFQQSQAVVLQEVPDAVRIVHQEEPPSPPMDSKQQVQTSTNRSSDQAKTTSNRKSNLPKSRSTGAVFDGSLTSAEAQQVRTQPLTDFSDEVFSANIDFLNKDDSNGTLIDFIKNRKKQFNGNADEGSTQKQQILEELHRVERELHGKTQAHNHVFQYAISQEQCPSSTGTTLQHMLNIDIAMQQQKQQGLGTGMLPGGTIFPGQNLQVHNAFYTGGVTTSCLPPPTTPKLAGSSDSQPTFIQQQQSGQQQAATPYYFAPLAAQTTPSLSSSSSNVSGTGHVTTVAPNQPIKFQSVTSHSEVSQNTAISDRPKAKPVSKKEGKNIRKQQQQQQQQNVQQQQTQQQHIQQQNIVQQQQQSQTFQPNIYSQQQTQIFGHVQLQQPQQLQVQTQQFQQQVDFRAIAHEETLNVQDLQDMFVLKNENHENLLTASILQQFHNSTKPALKAAFVDSSKKSRLELYDHSEDGNKVTKLELSDQDFTSVDDVVQTLESLNASEVGEQTLTQHNLQVQPYPSALDESMIAQLASQQDLPSQTDLSRVEYFAVPASGTQVPVHALYPYEHYIGAGLPKDQLFQAGFQAGYSLMQQQLVPTTVSGVPGSSTQQYVTPQQPVCTATQAQCNHVVSQQHCQIPCGQHQQIVAQQQQQQQTTHQVQAATQTPQATQTVNGDTKKTSKNTSETIKLKKGRLLRHQNQTQQGSLFTPNQNYQIDPNSAITQYNGANQQCTTAVIAPCMDVDSETESNHDTALTLACAGGHEELVELLINRGADIEHRDKKGFTPLILAATAGHEKVVEILLNHNAEIEAQSERTKDTPLSLACSGGRYEVVELLLNRNANKEHRNVSDYTPLSLAASGGYVNIIKLLLNHGAEINSRTGSKLGISPLMLAAMNGHTAAVKMLLDMGSDINAQIETNRNTALTLACFQGRHEVVSLLLDRKANVEHRAKTGLTPLMEAASGGYVEVGRVLLDKGADVNATPVPSSRDTALTIAADKGHVRFVELLLCRRAQVEVKNKKGNSPLWLAANGGHLPVVELLYNVNADIDSQDNRKVSCLMAAFRKGHVKVVKWMVHHVTQFPSDQEMMRYNATISDKDLLEKCQECVKIIRAAKETQAAKANKNASILLEELETEKTREESKRLAAARRRERKKKKKLEKKEERRRLLEENKKNENYDEKKENKQPNIEEEKPEEEENVPDANPAIRNGDANDKEEGDSGIDANSQGSCSSADLKSKEKRKEKKKKKSNTSSKAQEAHSNRSKAGSSKANEHEPLDHKSDKNHDKSKQNLSIRKGMVFEATKSPADRDDFEATGNEVYVSTSKKNKQNFEDNNSSQQSKNATSPKQSNKRDEGWKEVVRKSSVQAVSTSESGLKKVSVPLNAISRVIGRAGSNINAIRGATGAHIEVEKQSKGQGERIITIKGSAEATKQAHNLITALIKDPEVDIMSMLPKANKTAPSATTLWDKTQIGTKKNAGKMVVVNQNTASSTNANPKVMTVLNMPSTQTNRIPSSTIKLRGTTPVVMTRVTAPRLVAQAEKNAAAQMQNSIVRIPMSSTASRHAATKAITSSINQTFAAKLTETSSTQVIVSTSHNITTKPTSGRTLVLPHSAAGPISPQNMQSHSNMVNALASPNKNTRPAPTASAPPNMQHFQPPGKLQPIFGQSNPHQNQTSSIATVSETNTIRSSTPNMMVHSAMQAAQDESLNMQTPSEYSLFYTGDHWNRREQESQKPINFAAVTGGSNSQSVVQPKFPEEPPPQVDASKAPGYRGGAVCSPVSSKTSSSSTTPPNISANSSFQGFQEPNKPQSTLAPIGSNVPNRPSVSQGNPDYFGELFKTGASSIPNMLNLTSDAHLLQSGYNTMQNLNFSQPQPQMIQPSASMSRLNPKAPEYSGYNMQNKSSLHIYNNGYQMNNQNNMYMSKQQQQQQQQPQCGLDNFHRSGGMNSSQNRLWMQMQAPFTQQESQQLMNNIAGMTLHNIAKFTAGNEVLENGGELGMVNNSPTMSPNLPPAHGLHPDSMYSMEDRKPPQPIGTGRKGYNNPMESWRMNDKPDKWSLCNNTADFSLRNPQMYEDIPPMDYTRPMASLDTSHNFINGPPYFNQPPMTPARHDFMQDISKLDLTSWDNTPRPMTDLQDKPHGWTNKWNQ